MAAPDGDKTPPPIVSESSADRQAGGDRSRGKLVPPGPHERLEVGTHAQLMRALPLAVARVAEDPHFSVMLMINPVLALQHYGIQLTPELRRHVMQVLRHPKPIRDRRDELEASLAKALGERPQPTSPAWLARFLFERQRLPPLQIGDYKPAYRPLPNAPLIARLQAARPANTARYPPRRAGTVQSRIALARTPQPPGRLDMAAPAPKLPQAPSAPDRISLEDAWFYKDLDKLVRDVVELGSIQRRALRFHLGADFTRIANGDRSTAFRTWITALRLKDASS